MLDKFSHPLKAPPLIELTESGMVTLAKLLHFQNAESPMEVMSPVILTIVIFV